MHRERGRGGMGRAVDGSRVAHDWTTSAAAGPEDGDDASGQWSLGFQRVVNWGEGILIPREGTFHCPSPRQAKVSIPAPWVKFGHGKLGAGKEHAKPTSERGTFRLNSMAPTCIYV
jgi:hypothetical protein